MEVNSGIMDSEVVVIEDDNDIFYDFNIHNYNSVINHFHFEVHSYKIYNKQNINEDYYSGKDNLEIDEASFLKVDKNDVFRVIDIFHHSFSDIMVY